MDGPIREHCQIGDYRWPGSEQEGESLEHLLQEELEIEYEPAKDLAEILIDLDPAWPPDGDEPFFASDQSYHRGHVYSLEYATNWKLFSNRIQHERRFFDDEGRSILARILGEPGDGRASELPVFEIGPGTRLETVFRARRAESEGEAAKFVNCPGLELGPPPASLAIAGRMNAAGIPVFYGAGSESTAVAEVRPSVGGLVVVGGFRPSRRLRLLDLSQIGVGFTGSIFAPGYEDRADRRSFLEGFHRLIARPVQPHHEPLEHIPTQAVAEYVSNVLGFDGILYASAQTGAVPEPPEPSHVVHLRELSDEELGQHNIVLFGGAARVASEEQSPASGGADGGTLNIDSSTVRAQRVSRISYDYEWEYVHDPADGSDQGSDF